MNNKSDVQVSTIWYSVNASPRFIVDARVGGFFPFSQRKRVANWHLFKKRRSKTNFNVPKSGV